MSNKVPNAKKSKTASALKNRALGIFYIFAVLSVLISLPLMRGKHIKTRPVCFDAVCLQAEEALTAQQRQKGLSGRVAISDKAGMIFVFGKPARQCMWMKDMKFNLDIVWIDHYRRVVKIAKNISPGTFPKTFCADAAKYVLEVNSGKTDELSMDIGDLVQL